MPFIADLHLHSAYAYATSKDLTLENLAAWAKLKGIDLLATGDFTHPAWFAQLSEKLAESSPGLHSFQGANFALGTEVSCVYRQSGTGRRIHVLLIAPNLTAVAKLNRALAAYGDLAADGRPTLNLSVRDLTALALNADPQCLIVPAHVWTPWYGLYGSKSGFDRLADCFLDMTPHIHAVETGLSSDPEMNWGMAELADKAIVSFSDAHSLPKLGRELTAFDSELSYQGLAEALARNLVAYTIEFYPEEGKYHYNGHRLCGVRQSPEETAIRGTRCPVCGRTMTLGVLHRVRQLSDEAAPTPRDPDGFIRSQTGRPPFTRLVPLQELIAQALQAGVSSRKVQSEYMRLVREADGEVRVLLNLDEFTLEALAGRELAAAILAARRGQIDVEPGYDGVFGVVKLRVDSDGALQPPEQGRFSEL